MVRNRIITLLICSAAALAADPPTSSSTVPEAEQESYVHYVFGGAGPYAKSAAGAGISQATDTPAEWGGLGGYFRRLGSAFGKHVIKGTIQYEIGHWRHEEIHYRRSGKQGFRPRLIYALESTFITHKTTTGEPTVAAGELAGAVGSGLASRLWQPASTRTFVKGFASAGVSLGADTGYHVVREFWPEIRHPRRHKEKVEARTPVAEPPPTESEE